MVLEIEAFDGLYNGPLRCDDLRLGGSGISTGKVLRVVEFVKREFDASGTVASLFELPTSRGSAKIWHYYIQQHHTHGPTLMIGANQRKLMHDNMVRHVHQSFDGLLLFLVK